MNQPQFRETPGGIKTTNRLGVLALAGLVGGIVGFALSELFGPKSSVGDSASQLKIDTGIWFALALFGAGLGVANAPLPARTAAILLLVPLFWGAGVALFATSRGG